MGLHFALVLLCGCDLSYLQSVPTHSPLCRSRKWGHELSSSKELPPAAPPEHISLDLHPIWNSFFSTMPPLLRELLFYWAYFWAPKVLSGKAERTALFDANQVIPLHLLACRTYRSVGNASEGMFDLPWLSLTIPFFIWFIYTPRVPRHCNTKDWSHTEHGCVFKLASVILQPLKNPWGHTFQGLKERNKENKTKSPVTTNGQKLQLHYHSPSSAQKPSLQGLSWWCRFDLSLFTLPGAKKVKMSLSVSNENQPSSLKGRQIAFSFCQTRMFP